MILSSSGPISFGEIKEWIPWGDTYDLVTLKGRHIVDALEQSVANHGGQGDNWYFMHVSGRYTEGNIRPQSKNAVSAFQISCKLLSFTLEDS